MRRLFPLEISLVYVALLHASVGAQPAESPHVPVTQRGAIPVEDLVRNADFEDVSLSPDGKRMALIARHPAVSIWGVVYTAEGHGFNQRENRIDYFKRIEAFLGKHLRGLP